jgi:nicotinamide riboside transporter PnuC
MAIIEFVASGLIIIAFILIGKNLKLGFMINSIACTIWIYIGITKGMYGLVTTNIFVIFISLKNWIEWNKKENVEENNISQNSSDGIKSEQIE